MSSLGVHTIGVKTTLLGKQMGLNPGLVLFVNYSSKSIK